MKILGYAKILPRKKPPVCSANDIWPPPPPAGQPGDQWPARSSSPVPDMWARKPDDNIIQPKFLFQHPVYTGIHISNWSDF